MQRGAVVAIVIGVLLVGGVGAAVALSAGGGAAEAIPSATPSATAVPEPTETAESAEPDPAPTVTVDELTPGAYVEYSDAALAAAEGTRILFFHAPWCPQCRALEEDILATGVPDGFTILKVDYDSRQDLRQQHDVRLQTTLVALDETGGGTALFVAYDEPTLDASLTGLGLAG